MDHNPLVEQVGAPDQSRLCRWRFLDWLCKLCHILFKRPKRGDPCVIKWADPIKSFWIRTCLLLQTGIALLKPSHVRSF